MKPPDRKIPSMTEADWQRCVIDLARAMGWRVYHPFDSRRSTEGWPDLAMVRGPELVFAELKTEKGKTTPAQDEWLEALTQVSAAVGRWTARAQSTRPGPRPRVGVYVWRPGDWDAVYERLAR